MSLIYVKSDSIGRKIIPAPIVTLNKQFNRNQDGSKVGTVYNITLKGTLLPFRGSPSGNYSSLDQAFHTGAGYPVDESFAGNNEDFDSILRKQEALRWLFNEDGGSLEWQASGGQPVVKCNPKVISIDFTEGSWADRCDYTIQLETNWVFINGTSDIEDSLSQDLIASSNETWGFEESEGRNGKQFNVTHNVTAQGILGFTASETKFEGKDAWEHARDYVNARINGTINSSIITSVLGSGTRTAGQYVKSTNIDKNQGSYEIIERWLLSDQTSYTEQQFNVEFDKDTGEYSVTYEGTITGVSSNKRSGDTLNMESARAQIPSDAAAKTITANIVGILLSGKSLPASPSTRTFALNQQNGTVTFTFKWTTSDNQTTTITEEVQYTTSIDSRSNVVSFTETIEPYGSTSAIKVANAKAAIYSDTVAYNRAIALLSGQILVGIIINSTTRSKTLSVNQKTGSTRVGWTWDNRDIHSQEVSIQIQNPNVIFASLAIPGRTVGPIIQNMQTSTSKITTVTIRSKNHTSQPTLNTSLYASGLIISDSETWNPETGTSERTTRFLKET